MRFIFSLRNQGNAGVIVPAEEMRLGTVISEREPGEEQPFLWEGINTAETNFFVDGAERFQQEIVFVLDLSKSMSDARLRDGMGGIQGMMVTFFRALLDLPEEYGIGVVEFHDRDSRPSVVSEITDDRDEIRRRVSAFVTTDIEPGASRVRDAIGAAASLFSSTETKPDVVKAVVLFSDGRDTSSDIPTGGLTELALANGMQLFSVGMGDVIEEPGMIATVLATGGAVYAVTEGNLIHVPLEMLTNDLRGQYRVSYVTLRRSGGFHAQVVVRTQGVSASFESDELDASTFHGPDIEGVIVFDRPLVDSASRKLQVLVRALHVPRKIKLFRFRLDTPKAVRTTLVPGEEGGLLEGWKVSGPDDQGYFTLSSDRTLDFGSFGPLFWLTLSDVTTEESLEIPFELDNLVYRAGKSFQSPATLGGEPPAHVSEVPAGGGEPQAGNGEPSAGDGE